MVDDAFFTHLKELLLITFLLMFKGFNATDKNTQNTTIADFN